VKFLGAIGDARAYAMANPNLEVNVLEMSCRTRKNKKDCAIFVMRYMETYMGSAKKKYSSGFGRECGAQDTILLRMRTRYLHRLVTFEKNKLKDDIMAKVIHYKQTVPFNERENQKLKSLMVITERLNDVMG
jgi:hypothetical protein